MTPNNSLLARSQNACELCLVANIPLHAYLVPTRTDEIDDNIVVLCDACMRRIREKRFDDPEYFRFLAGSVWSDTPAVKVLSHRLLSKLPDCPWAEEALAGAYLDEKEWAWSQSEDAALAAQVIHRDANGAVLQHGDNVFLTENLPVKGANFTIAKGTKVSKIRLVADNADQIEGKIEGTTIVILTKYVRKG